MSVIQLVEPASDIQQKTNYNSNVGGLLNRREEFVVPAGTSWAVVGCVLVDSAVPGDVDTALIPSLEALAEVTSVNGNQLWGQIPATIEASDHEAVLHISSSMSATIGLDGSKTFTRTVNNHKSIKPPLGKKWVVLAIRTPAPLDAAKITSLQNAIEGIAGVTTAVNLIDDIVSDRATASASLVISAHVRIDPLPV